MKKIYKLLYIFFGKFLFTSNAKFFGFFAKKIRAFWFVKINDNKETNINIDRNVTFGENIKIGFNSGIGKNSFIQGNVTFGENVLCGPEVLIYTVNHKFVSNKNIISSGLTSKRVVVGNNVWIGTRVIILPGVHIGNNVIIGAGAVVTKSFPSNVLIAGNPAQIKKKLEVNNESINNNYR